jgi:hypothetical protein
MVIYAAAFARFVDDDEFVVVMELLDKLIPLVKQPTDDIAKNMKILAKNANKNILVYLAVTLSIYNKEQI